MKTLKFPSAQTVLLIIAAFVALLTWLIPSGQFDRLSFNKDDNTFLVVSNEKSINLDATQKTLDSLTIKIPLEKFTSGAIYKPISIPGTYKKLKAKPQGFIAFIQAPLKGIIAVSDIIILVLFIGGLVAIVNYTGAFEAGISKLSNLLLGKEYILIITVTILIAIGGSTFGLAEETIAFYPILVPIFIAAKYDAIVALACVFVGSSIGTMVSTTNPFSTIIASNSAGINWTTGIEGRIIMLVIGLITCIIYILKYAQKVKKDATKSIIYDQKEQIEKLFLFKESSENIRFDFRLKLVLFIFALCFVVMVYGVVNLDWWFIEMTAVFFVGALLIGFICRINETTFVETFIKGANELLSVAFIIGLARGVTILMEDGLISDTLLFYSSSITDGMNKGIFINSMMFIYSGLGFFIPSSSGMAVLTMPIMSPLADTVAIGREHIVNAYLLGMGLFNFINPTGLVLASLAMVKVGYNKWLKFVIPLVLILVVISMILPIKIDNLYIFNFIHLMQSKITFMEKEAIADLLENKHKVLFDWLDKQPIDIWEKGPKDKWTTGQHIKHLVDSLQLLNKALSYPRFFLKHKFGLCNRENRSYTTVAENYRNKLSKNKERARIFNQKLQKPTLKQRDRLLTKFQIQQKKLQYKVKKISNKNLDSLLIPHPLMGKMTLREIIMWTAYHTEHHTETLKKNYGEKNY